ncbi:hypothetical protein [Serratia quinivorans]|uniref:hypothetical protein n=1 Tax=Serratia quinivorans TaxID=137545 RepID=UPI00217B8864|nr:hypothetical protein [Serratia quinivorans]CAI0806613.1 Uncharacterised protein [Serratia quinivorans]
MTDTIIEYVTPEMFGAVGDGVADDTLAWQTAVSKGVDIHANSQARYLITSPIKLPYMSGYQLIEGNNCTLITLGNYSPFGQLSENGTAQVITIRKNFQNIIAIGGVNKNTAWNNASSAVFLSFSYGYAKNINAIGFCNALRAYGYTWAENIFADDLRNALWSAYDPGYNSISNSRCVWCSGDGIIIKCEHAFVDNIHFEYAGCISVDNEDGTAANRGVVISSGADMSPAQYVSISNVTCQYFGAGAINLNAKSLSIGGALNFGSIYEGNFLASKSTSAIWLSVSDSDIGDIKLGNVYAAIGINARTSNTRIGTVDIKSKMSVAGASLLSITDSIDSKIIGLEIDSITFHGQSTLNDDIYLNTEGVRIGRIFVNSLANQQGGNSVNFAKACRVDSLYLQATTSSATNNICYFSAPASVGTLEIIRVYGSAIVVASDVVPDIGNVYIRNKQGVAAPIKIIGTGSKTHYWGNVYILGVSIARPTVAGTLVMQGYSGPSWRLNESAILGATSFPEKQLTVLND